MEDNRYNGWSNRETWNVALWLGNDEGLYCDTIDMARRSQGDVRDLANKLSDYVDDIAELTCPGCREGASFVSDIVGYALALVDWDEIAENLIADEATDRTLS